MKAMKNSRRGSSAVFLSLILAALMSVTLAMVYSVKASSVSACADGIIDLACESVMSEFDHRVQKEYGLFMIKGTDRELAGRIDHYLDYTFKGMKNVRKESVSITAARFPMSDIALTRTQILECMKFMEANELLKKAAADKKTDTNDMQERKLQHGPTIASLPSSQVPEKGLTALASSIGDKASDVKEVFKEGSENYLMNQYITMHFNNRTEAVNKEHFFKNEVEYILGGKLTDRKNERKVKIAVEAMRFPPNLAHIYSDPKKKAEVLAAAELITPGAGAATQLAVASTWAYAESANDVKLLWMGRKVPMVKDKDSWATDIDGAVKGAQTGVMMPDVEKGYTYEQYLEILLFFKDNNVKTARVLDLIQINMRKNRDRRFLINEHSAGIAAEVRVNGRTYSYEKKY